MDYTEAAKKVKAIKSKENYMVIKLGYSNRIILPYSAGVSLMASLANAEQFIDAHSSSPRIEGFDPENIQSTVLSASEYENYKIAALLNVSLDEVKEYARQAA